MILRATYNIGQKLIFTEFDYETAVVVSVRPGNNPDYGHFNVIAVQFDDDDLNIARKSNANLHPNSPSNMTLTKTMIPTTRLVQSRFERRTRSWQRLAKKSSKKVEEKLRSSPDLIYMARKWFPRDLLMDVNVGHLNLAEAVLDINGGGPMRTRSHPRMKWAGWVRHPWRCKFFR